MPSSDFNGDGRADILWRNASDGRVTDWLGTTSGGFQDNVANGLRSISPNWQLRGIGDFNGDGRDDILWQHNDGRVTDWLSTSNGGFASNSVNAVYSVAPQWETWGIGDFNGDGRDDILWRNTNGQITNWLGTASGSFSDNAANALSAVAIEWGIAGVGDFNGDGRADILWRNTDGRITNWLGTETGGFSDNVSNAYNAVATEWQVAGVGDFNGDGRDDILWRNEDGRLSDWLATAGGGYAPNSSNALYAVATDWRVAEIADYNGDGRDDVLWRNGDGRITDWLGSPDGSFFDNAANAFTTVDWPWLPQPNPTGAGMWDY